MVNVHQASPETAIPCARRHESAPGDTWVAAPLGLPVNAKETPLARSGVKWLSPHTLAQRWGVSRETVLRMVRSGELPVHRLNARVYRIAEADAEDCARRRYGNLARLGNKPEGVPIALNRT